MDKPAVARLLRAFRRLRLGSLQPGDAPEALQRLLADGGLGSVCEHLINWIDAAVAEPRSAEAMNRFFGIGRLPEEQDQIGRSLPGRSSDALSFLGAPRHISARQVQNLIGAGMDALVATPSVPLPAANNVGIDEWVDPFPAMGHRPTAHQLRTLFWAWAQVAEGTVVPARALVYYEYEHGLRLTAPEPTSRMERRRWRHLAWSILDVAGYRLRVATGSSSVAGEQIIRRAIGPSRPTATGTGGVSLIEPYAVDAFNLLLLLPAPKLPREVIHEALQTARQAVRERWPEAPELVGVLCQRVLGVPPANRPHTTPPDTTSKLLALRTILSKEHRDIAGVPVGEAAIHRNLRQLAVWSPKVDRAAHDIVVSDTLRTTQELAELWASLGEHLEAWRALRQLQGVLNTYGDPEQEQEPQGWLNQLLLTAARLERHIAPRSRYPRRWLDRAAAHAERAAELALDTGRLPVPWGLSALNQRANVTLDLAQLSDDTGSANQLLATANRQIDSLRQDWASVPEIASIEDRPALLEVHLTSWRAAILGRNSEDLRAARSQIITTSGPWLVAGEVETIRKLEQLSVREGLAPPELANYQWPDPYDRIDLRPPTSPHLPLGRWDIPIL